MEYVNRIMLSGTVNGKSKEGLMIETSELSFDGNDTYVHLHPVHFDNPNDFKAVKKGSTVKIDGKFGRDDERRGRIEAVKITPNYAGPDVNKGELQGLAHRSFQFFPATKDKKAFGNVIVRLDDGLMIRGVCFIPTCHRFERECTTGSWVQVLGRIQHRGYIDRQGNSMTMIEVVGDDDFTNVITSKELQNPFDVAAEEGVEAI
jgi:hypothetical protein